MGALMVPLRVSGQGLGSMLRQFLSERLPVEMQRRKLQSLKCPTPTAETLNP